LAFFIKVQLLFLFYLFVVDVFFLFLDARGMPGFSGRGQRGYCTAWGQSFSKVELEFPTGMYFLV
jgi:hypothetical protein